MQHELEYKMFPIFIATFWRKLKPYINNNKKPLINCHYKLFHNANCIADCNTRRTSANPNENEWEAKLELLFPSTHIEV